MEILSRSTQETKELACKIAPMLKRGAVIALYGDLGSGKTTFVAFLVEALGIKRRVQSPTFVLLRKYDFVNHLDLYRLQNAEDICDLGVEDLFSDKNSITLIEWPEKLENLLPKETVRIKFDFVDENTRRINVQNLY